MIVWLPADWVFVFGSNLAGRHGAGAAKTAVERFGAVMGVGEGPAGQSYALPTKDALVETLPLGAIAHYVDRFLVYARLHADLTFVVTRVGCGLAGYTDEDIAPLFTQAPANCVLPEGWDRE